jgi:hypothetical protein
MKNIYFLMLLLLSHGVLAQTNSFPLYSNGTYTGGSGDFTNITNAQLKLQAGTGFIRIPHISAASGTSTIYNYESGKTVYWGESTDAGQYFFRGRDFILSEGKLGIGISTPPPSKFFVANGTSAFQILNEPVGVGDMLSLSCQVGYTFVVNAFGPLQQKLITNIGANYAINGNNGTEQYTVDGSKKSPIIQFDAEQGAVNIYGENGTGADYRTPVLNLGLSVAPTGFVGIGTASPDQKLTVKGIVHAQEVRVDLSVPGPDYVFEKNYKLPTLEEIKSYIDQNKHLPEVPSAAEMEKNGVQLGEMNMLLLKKVEELTLYAIELKKENKEVKTRLNKIENAK